MHDFETTGPASPFRCANPASPQEWQILLLAGTRLRLPDGTEIRWNVEDNAELLKRRRPDPPGLVLTVRYPPVLDGAALRRARERQEVPLRRVAAMSGLSHGYLSKVERGEPGRSVTAEVLAAYRRAGVALPGTAVGGCPVPTADERHSSSSLLTRGGLWRTRNNDERWPRRWSKERSR